MKDTFARAINKPRLFLGIGDRRIVFGCLLLAFLVAVTTGTLVGYISGALIGSVTAYAANRAAAREPMIIPILTRVVRQKSAYDPLK